MVLSEMLRSSVGTLSLVTGMVILSIFVNVPEHLRVLSQVWSYLPSEFRPVDGPPAVPAAEYQLIRLPYMLLHKCAGQTDRSYHNCQQPYRVYTVT